MKTVITDQDMGLVCDGKRCTRQAHYVMYTTDPNPKVGLACPRCCAVTLQRCCAILEKRGSLLTLHDVVIVEHLVMGAVVNA